MKFDKLKPGMFLYVVGHRGTVPHPTWIVIKHKSSDKVTGDWYFVNPHDILLRNYDFQFNKFHWDDYSDFVTSKPATVEQAEELIIYLFKT